jgi:hypothetical protein
MRTLNWQLQKLQTPIAGTVPSDLTTRRFRFDMDTVSSPDITSKFLNQAF